MAGLSPDALRLLDGFASTQDRWSVFLRGQRFYRPERALVHRRVGDGMIEGTEPANDPQALIVAGGPASGKSTLLTRIDLPPGAVHLDADAIKSQIPEYAALVAIGEPLAAAAVHEESSDLARAILMRVLVERRNLVLDTVGDSAPGVFVEKLERLHAAGYEVRVVYADVEVEAAVRRARERGLQTGRVVAEQTVRMLHQEVAARFPEVEDLPWLAGLQLYATDHLEPRLIAERSRDGSLSVLDGSRLKAFRQKSRT
ncbi:MAG TPA: zeta toxin family protein [Solirubrobacteraceae bacterium]|jgi:predicted ABC-type ATPase